MPELDVEVLIVGDQIKVIVPKQAGVDYEAAAPALRRFCESLSAEYNAPVTLEGVVEKHTHGPEGSHVHQSHTTRA
jgi:hypothetical protein